MNALSIFSTAWLTKLFNVGVQKGVKIAYLKDVKPSGVNGGVFTSGVWHTRDLNTVEGDLDIVSLNANQFTLQSGKYLIEVQAPAFDVSQHKCLLRNVTNATDDILGKSAFNDSTGGGFSQNDSLLMGEVTINQPTVFEVRHRGGANSNSDNGFGLAGTLGVSEVYTQVKITKLA